jgi:hypothetical protein
MADKEGYFELTEDRSDKPVGYWKSKNCHWRYQRDISFPIRITKEEYDRKKEEYEKKHH